MTGLLSVGNRGLTPQQIKELQLRQALSAAKTGPVLPPQGAVGQAPAGLLGADPVATQQQSRVNPNTPGSKPIYVDTAGNAGRSIPAGSGANVAYGAQPTPTPKAGMGQVAKGLLGRAGGAVMGPAGLGVSLLGGGTPLADGTKAKVFSPEEIKDAQKYAQSIRGKSQIPATGSKLLTMGQNQPQEAQGAPAQSDMPYPDLPVAEPADAPSPNLAAEQAMLQTKVKSQLEDGSVSKPKLAAQVVDAQIAQKGGKFSKTERDKMVKEETGFFRSMDEDTVAKYVSTIMMGAGVYSAMMGDGQSAQALFGQANTVRGAKAKREADEADAAAALRKEGREERKVIATELDAKSKAGYRETQGKTAKERLDIERAALGIAEGRAGAMAGKAESESELAKARAQRLEAQTAFDAKKLEIDQQRADAYAKKQASGGGGGTLPTLTFKDNKELTEKFLEANGLGADDAVVEAISQQLMGLQKYGGDLTVEEMMEEVTKQFNLLPAEAGWFSEDGFGSKPPRLSYKKLPKEEDE